MPIGPSLVRTVVPVACAAALAGCSGSHRSAADKAGGAEAPPVVLRLGYVGWVDSNDDAGHLGQFAADVARRSGGRLRVRLLNETGYAPPDEEVRIARGVRDGRFDLGWISTRRWDDLGVSSFEALQAPFLITDYATMHAVGRSPLAGRMLAGLRRYGVVGLALVPRTLLHPDGPRPLLAPHDYAGMQFLVARSPVTDALLASLGAKAVHTLDSVTSRGPPGAILPLYNVNEKSVETWNVALYARFDTLFVNPAALDRLSADQRSALRDAARTLVAASIAKTPSEHLAAKVACQRASIATASRADLARLAAAARPVTARLERNPQTRAFVAAIRRVRASTPPDPALAVPARCRPHRPPRAPRPSATLSPSVVDGTYRYVLTRAAAAAFGPPATNPGNRYPVVETWTLHDGDWESKDGSETGRGTYTLTRKRIAFVWPRAGYTNRFSYTRDGDGTLHLEPVPPIDRGDEFVWASQPWRRIGPPTR